MWRYRPRGRDGGELLLVFESPSRDVLDSPDNITVSPRGGIVICEDGRGRAVPPRAHAGRRDFRLGKNFLNDTEFAGACFSPDGRVLFVNIMGSTVDSGHERADPRIQGPWERGAL